MPFGLKGAPSIFQRKMNDIFRKFRKFICVYIDDILVQSKPKEEHIGHLRIVLSEFLKQGIVISYEKALFFRYNIEVLGVETGNRKVLLQPHISKKI